MPDRAAKLYPVIPFLRGWALTPELEHETTRLDLALPCPAKLDLVLNGIIESAGLTGHRDNLTPIPGARRMKEADWEGLHVLHVLRDLRRDVIG